MQAIGMTGRAWSRTLLILALFLWGASLALPAVNFVGGPDASGFDVLKQGWSAWRNGVYSWFANPAFLLALGLSWFRVDRSAVAMSAGGLILALTSWWAPDIARGSGLSVPELSYVIGFYFWIGANFGAFAATVAGLMQRKNDL